MITVRPATADDAPQLAGLVSHSCNRQSQFDDSVKLAPDPDWIGFVSRKLAHKDTEIFIAEKDRILVGYVCIYVVRHRDSPRPGLLKKLARKLIHPLRTVPTSPSPVVLPREYGVIEDIFVIPSMQKKPVGVGLKLYKKSLTWFEAQQVHSIECVVATGNRTSRGFFGKLGFEPVRVQMKIDI